MEGSRRLGLETVAHIGIVVRDCEKVAASWERIFGIAPWTFKNVRGSDAEGNPTEMKLAFAYLGEVELELIEVVEGRAFHSEFLEKHGEGLHHLGFFVDEVDGEAGTLAASGARILTGSPGNWVYLDNFGPGGTVFELINVRRKNAFRKHH